MSFFPSWAGRREQIVLSGYITCSGSSDPTLNTTDLPLTAARTGTGTYTLTVKPSDLKIRKLKSFISDATTSTAAYSTPGAEVAWSDGVLTFKTFDSGSAADLTGTVHFTLTLGA